MRAGLLLALILVACSSARASTRTPTVVVVPEASATPDAVARDEPPPARLGGRVARESEDVATVDSDEAVAAPAAWSTGPSGGVVCQMAVACCRKAFAAAGQAPAQLAGCNALAKNPDALCAQLLKSLRILAQTAGAHCN